MSPHAIPYFRSLRARILMLLLTAAAISAISAALLAYGLTISQRLIDKAQASQVRIESHLSLASRLGEYRYAATALISQDNDIAEARQRINKAYEPVRRAFTRLLSLNVLEVDNETDDDKSAAATKGIHISRMKALFENLHQTILGSVGSSDNVNRGEGALNAFGIAISPVLFQSIEDERKLTEITHGEISALRQKLIIVSIALAAAALVLAIALYLWIGRPLMKRIAETVEGAEAIAKGKLDTRLKPTGQDELTDLMSRFNVMAGNMATRENDLRVAQKDLQQTIRQQTGDLRNANERLARIDRTRRRFFSDISHELRTPLTVVQGEAEYNLNIKAKPKAAEMRQSFSTILARVQELRRRVDDMLRVARSESGRLDLSFGKVDLTQVVSAAAAQEMSPAKRLQLEVHLTEWSEKLVVNADSDWLRQTISGLIANARKHSPPKTRIALKTSRLDNSAILEVRDAGSGIDPKILPHVFDRFIQAAAAKSQGKSLALESSDGFGIGLNLAKWIIEEHSGTISIDNNKDGPGVTVVVTLPLAEGSKIQGGGA